MKCDYILCGNSIEAQLGRFLDNVLNKLSDVTDVLKHSANNLDMNNLPIDKESLMRLFDIVNKI
jgi:hypothetical protein